MRHSLIVRHAQNDAVSVQVQTMALQALGNLCARFPAYMKEQAARNCIDMGTRSGAYTRARHAAHTFAL